MEETILLTLWSCAAHFSSLALPFQVMLPVCVLLGVAAGFRLVQKWYLFAGLLLVLYLACEGICWLFEIFAVFPLFFTGMMALCVLFGDLAGTLLCKIWTKVHH